MALSGWGNFPTEVCRTYRETQARELAALVCDVAERRLIPRGLGRSYGDAALNREGVVDVSGRDRLIAFDETNGMLECEAGVSLACIVATFLPRGWFLPVTPGTKFVTVGGAIAADVHGKNHHVDGTLGNFVHELELLTADGSVLRCSRERNREAFCATLGGMGLTGIILSAKLTLRRVQSAYVRQTTIKCANLDVALERLEQSNDDYRYSVGWIDCLASGGSLGRTVLMLANEAAGHGMRVTARAQLGMPFNLPSSAFNLRTVTAFNAAYYRRQREGEQLIDYYRYFYPLDAIRSWNRMYGRRGFIQYQALVPLGTARGALVELLEAVSQAGLASFLAVLKRSGNAGEGILSFPFPGYTLALDIPNRGDATRHLARTLDRILLRHGGRIYLAKDAVTDAETFAAMYPSLPSFRSAKGRLDPAGRFSSSLSRRVGIST